MIGPTILKGDIVERFREHLSNFSYYHIVHQGISYKNSENRPFNIEERDLIISNFISSDLPIVCMAGSKSSIPFWDYHCAVNINIESKEAYVSELLIKEPKDQNLLNGLTMALFFLSFNRKYRINRLIIPLLLLDYEFEEGIKVEFRESDNSTVLYLNNN